MRKSVKKEVLIIIGIFILAFAIRFIYLLEMRSSPLFDTPTMDAEYHDQWAQSILKGEDFTGGVFFRAPLYSYFLAAVYKLFGHNYFTIRLIQFILGSLSCILVYLLGRKVFNKRVAIIAGVMASLYGVLIYYEGELLLPVLEVFLNLLFLFACIKAREKTSYKLWFLSGLLLGLSALVRPNILLVGAALFLWILLKSTSQSKIQFPRALSTKSMLYSVCLALGAILLIIPVTLRNYIKGHDFVLISSQGGMNFYIGNNPKSDGATAIFPGGSATWWGSYEDAVRLAEKKEGRSLKPSEISSFWYREGLDFVLNQPFQFLKLMLKKFALFWNGDELSNNRDFYFFARSAPILKLLIWKFIIYFPFGLITPLGLLGIILFHLKPSLKIVKERDFVNLLEIFLFVYMLSVILFFVTARYRVPILPILLIFAAFALEKFYPILRKRRVLEFGKYLLILVIILILVNIRLPGYSTANPGQAYYTLGVVYAKKGDMTMAEEEYRKAVFYNPGLGNAYANLASIYGDQGKHDMSLEYYQKALENGADSSIVYYNLGVEYYNQGLLDQALRDCETSLSLKENDPKVHYLLGEIYLLKGLTEEATREYQNTIKYDPQNALAFYRLGSIYQQIGNQKEAINNFENFIRLWNGDPVQIEKVQKTINELRRTSSERE
ncbi:MAG: glycosyltransferase family 39 protein [Candidatus Zixiibacteriota bacterium]